MMFGKDTHVLAGKKLLALGLFSLLILPAVAGQRAFADGLFQEHIGATLQGRDVNLFIRVNPPILTTETAEDRFLQLRLFEGNNETIQFTTFGIEIFKVTNDGEERLLTYDAYHTESGLLTIRVDPSEGETQVFATREDFTSAYKADPGGTINIRGPLLLEGGLYHFRIEVLAIDHPRGLLNLDQIVTFDSYLSVGDVVTQDVQYQGETYPTTLVSYYDQIQDFSFDSDSLTYSWSMPFDWDVERIQEAETIFVHEEIQIPKSFAGVGDAVAFDATVNNQPISARMLSVDPFSSQEDLTLHFLINRNDMLSFAQEISAGTETMDFAFSPASNGGQQTSGEMTTDTGGMLIMLDWTPDQLSADNGATLDLQFHDAFSGETITDDVTYDLRVFDPDGNEVYSSADQIAEGGTDSQTMTFPADETYRVEVEVTAVTEDGQTPDLTRNGIARGTVVVPEFPVGAIAAIAGTLGSIIAFHRLARKA